MTTIFLFLCFATVDVSNGNLKVTKLEIEKKEIRAIYARKSKTRLT